LGEGVRAEPPPPIIPVHQSIIMGTSTARRGPSTALWRLAKGAATRYLSPDGATPVAAREVVRRYVAALEDTQVSQGQDLSAGFRLTRKAAQRLGDFGDALVSSGLAAALSPWGLADAAQFSPEAAILGLTSAWVEDHGGLEAAVARTALATCLGRVMTSDPAGRSQVDSPSVVKAFLAVVLYQRLVLDLGESLEAVAPGWPAFQEGLARLAAEITAAGAAFAGDPPQAGQWGGLTGWVYVTTFFEHLCRSLKGLHPQK
jgi:hypothetical protein